MPSKPHALVIGGSVGGLFAAHLLRAAGWEATVFERSTHDLAGRGAGIGLSQELLDVMDEIGVPFDPTMVMLHQSYLWLDADGSRRHEQPRASVGSSWNRVYRPLRAAFPDDRYHAGRALVRIEPGDDAVTAVFEDGTKISADLVVGADGHQSTVRAQFAPDLKPHYAGYVVWRGLVDADRVPDDTYRTVVDRLVFGFPENQMMLTMMVPGDDENPDTRQWRCYWAWYKAAFSDAELRDIFTDADGTFHGAAIPPPLIRSEVIAAIKAEARDKCAPVIAEMVARAPQFHVQTISDFVPPTLVFDRVALIGDAGFIARPHIAAGVTKAALDARSLVAALGRHASIADALAAYNAEQMTFGGALVGHARKLGHYLDHARGTGENGGEDLGAFLDPVHILKEYGAPHLLHDADLEKYRAS